MPTPRIFDFDENDLALYEPEEIDRILETHPAIYINHLGMARFLEKWADRLDADRTMPAQEREPAYAEALRTVAAHLRQGDFVPGGHMTSSE